jgi:hypothetical protein
VKTVYHQIDEFGRMYLQLCHAGRLSPKHLARFGEFFESEINSYLGNSEKGLEFVVNDVPKHKSSGERGSLVYPILEEQWEKFIARFEVTGGRDPHISVRSSARHPKREKKGRRPLYEDKIPITSFDVFEGQFKIAVKEIAKIYKSLV